MKKTLFLILISLLQFCYGQKYLDIDLSKTAFDEPTINLDYNGVNLINKLPYGNYTIKIKVEKELSYDGTTKTNSLSNCRKNNPDFVSAFSNVENEKSENKIPELIKKLDEAVDTLKGDCAAELKEEAAALKHLTTQTCNFTFDLEKNQNIFITIVRIGKDKKPEKTWEIILRTPRTANYISQFGFTFSPNWIKTSDLYYCKLSGKNIGNTDSFTITKLNSNGKEFWKDLSLTANFLIPFSSKKKDSDGSDVRAAWLAGFGVGGDARFTVFTGPALLLKDFTAIGLVFGVNYAYKLIGQYESGQGLKEQLSFDQLHVRGLRPDIMLTLSFRLSKKQLQGGDIENVGDK